MIKLLLSRTILITVWILCIQLSINNNVHAQDLFFSTLSVKDGLPSNIISGIAQDKNDFIWIGTGSGLARYDGNHFKTFKKSESFNSLPSNEISCLLKDGDFLWVGTWNGLCKINTLTFEITRIESIGTNAVRTLAPGLNHSVWVGTENGLIQLENVKNKVLKTFHTNNSGLSHNTIRSIYQERNGTLWVGTYDKLNKLSPGGGLFEVFNIKGQYKPILKNNLICGEIKPYSKTSDSLLWIGTETGLCLFNTSTNQYQLLGDRQIPLSNEVIKCIYISDTNDLWLGTDFGLNIFNPLQKNISTHFHNPKTPYSIANNAIWQIYEDRGGVIWFVTSNGLSRLNKHKNIYEFHEVTSKINNQTVGNQVKSILISKNEATWLATLHGVLRIDPKTNRQTLFDTSSPPEKRILLNNSYALEEDNYGRIWIGTAGGINIWDEPHQKMYSITANPTNGLVTNYVAKFIKSEDGSLWVSTYQGGLFKVVEDMDNLNNLKFQSVTKEFGSEKIVAGGNSVWFTMYNELFQLDSHTLRESQIESFNNLINKKDIHCLFYSNKQTLWAGTQNGLIQYIPEQNKTEFHPIVTGRDVSIGNLTEDNEGNLWGATNYFIFRYNDQTRETEMFPLDKDLPLKSFFSGCSYSNGNKVFFGGDNGFISVNAEKNIPISFQPRVYITSLEINNKTVSPKEEIDNKVLIENDISLTPELLLDFAHRSLTFEFSSLHYWQPSMNVFGYKLEGFDEDWIYVSGQKNFAVYSNLSPGHYSFKVRATNNYGRWSENTASIAIEVKPPLFLSNGFLALYGVLIVGSVFIGMRFYSSRLKLKNELDIARLEKKHTEELAQAKQQFFTNISHELRTPVSLIMPPIHQILKSGNLDYESRSLISLAEKNSHRLLRVINQILDFKKLENDSLQIKVALIDLVKFSREIHELFSDKANRKKIDFSFQSAVPELKIWIDAEKVETVLFNLLSNAFKFTNQTGRITVSLDQGDRSPAFPEGIARIKISDTGIGLGPAEMSRIFEPFYQTQEARQMEMGTGIGLALASEYVKLHRGQIKVDSIKGEGTTFSVMLPLGKSHFPVDSIHDEQELELTAFKAIDNSSGKQYRFDLQSNKPLILIIDDNDDMIDFIRLSLSHKYNFITAGNGEEGLQKINDFIPELIISDVMMPVMDGLTLCKKIKESNKASHISFILITAKDLLTQKIEGIRMGADVYITKPFEIEFLEAHIDHLLSRKQELIEYLRNVIITQPAQESGKENIDDRLIKKVMNAIEANIANSDFGVEQLSDEVGMSASYLYRKLKSLTRLSTNEIIKKYRLKKASILLKNKGGNVTEIMYDVGFSNLSYFSKCFKSEFGLNPKDYQQKMSKANAEFDLGTANSSMS